mmetsp:Transcript_12238/g.12320  ORF Transcript_12238/g.12320 Transcript_12238/m.12320 type:complete len:289 (-) Transcript_12238:83-949(-)
MESFKQHFSEKRHISSVSHVLPGPVLDTQLVRDDRYGSVVIGEKGRSHYQVPYGKEDEFKPNLKQVSYLDHSGDQILRGVRSYPQKVENNPILAPEAPQTRPLMRLVPEARGHVSGDNEMPAGWVYRNKVIRSDGIPAAANRSEEYNIEPTMSRKTRVDGLLGKRGNIPLARLGDKAYTSPEQSSGFYKENGLIPGSSITFRSSKGKGSHIISRENPAAVAAGVSETLFPPSLAGPAHYNEKKKKQDMNYDMEQVKALTESGISMGQKVLSWEQRTGLITADDDSDKE